jgi:hypothetical protein
MNDFLGKTIAYALTVIELLFGHVGLWKAAVGCLTQLMILAGFIAIAVICINIVKHNRFGNRSVKSARIILNIQAVLFSFVVAAIISGFLEDVDIPVLYSFTPAFLLLTIVLLLVVQKIGTLRSQNSEPS